MAVTAATASRRNWVTLPPLKLDTWLGGKIDRHELTNTAMFRVQIRGRGKGAIEQNWFLDRTEAYAFTLDRADQRGLPMIDLTSCGVE